MGGFYSEGEMRSDILMTWQNGMNTPLLVNLNAIVF
jgi:hypothetical protein